MSVEKYEILKQFAVGDKDSQLLDLLIAGKTQKEAADIMKNHKRTIEKRLKAIRDRASLKGYSPEHDMHHMVPDTHIVKGVSTLYRDGKSVLQWVKSDLNKEAQLESLSNMIEAMRSDIVEVPEPEELDVDYETDVIPFINIGDAHVNMLARVYETGESFNLETVEVELCKAIQILISQMPNYERVVINDLGDFTHMENFIGLTAAAGNQLDHDGAFPEMVKVATRIMRFIVNICLHKFKYVDLIINQGNHSRVNDIWTAELFKQLYQNYKRLTVLNNSNVFIPYRMGNTFVMVHHGDKCKPERLVSVMTADYPEDFGESFYRYIYVGHVHHKSVTKELNGVTVESFNTLAPKDKYAHDHGYRAASMITAVLLSKTYGEIGRFTVPVELVKDAISRDAGSEASVFNYKRKKVHTV